MSIGDATSSQPTSTATRTQSTSPSSPTSSSSSATSTADTAAVTPTPAVPQDQATVDRTAANENGNTTRVADVVSGLAETPTANPNAGALGRIDEITRADHAKYGGQTTTAGGDIVNRGVQEGQSPLRQDIRRMWENVGVNGRDGTSDQAWSAAYISDVMNRAGVDNFEGSIRHSDYVNGAIEAKKNGDTEASHWGYRPEERAPQAGDLVCFARGNSSATYDDQQGGKYQSHCDIVQGVRPGFIDTIGGNVGNSVSTRSFTTDENGMVNDPSQRWIAVLGPQQLGSQ